MTALTQDVVADLRRRVAELEQRLQSGLAERDEAIAQQAASAVENARLLAELRTARDRQAGSAEILRAIAGASGDAEQSLQQIAETTARLFGASSVTLNIASGNAWARMIRVGPSSQRVGSEVSAADLRIGGRNLPGTVFRENRQIHIPDLDDLDPAFADWPTLPHARAAGARALAGTPLRREGKAVGALVVHRDQPVPFTDEELALLQSFADQAVIAIENARLFNETREALEQQKASADILRAISSSVADTQPAFDKILESCKHLFGSDETAVLLVDDRGLVTLGAYVGKQHDAVAATFPAPVEKSPAGHAIRERRVVHYTDAANDAQLTRAVRHVAQVAGYEAMAYAPMMWNERGIGAIGVSRLKGAFSDKELALLQTFADQAVIAIQNARLFNETREALERQTATADILKVIASSPSDVQPVFEAIAASANRLIGGHSTAVSRFVDGVAHLAAFTPTSPAADEVLKASFPRPLADFPPFEHLRKGEAVQITDAETVPDVRVRDLARARGYCSVLFSPLMSNGAPIGVISVTRVETGSFADHHVQLLQTFADQAVIAIENTRLFNETREALERQTATADILKVIASSPSDVQPVFEAIATSANRLIGGYSTSVLSIVDDTLHLSAFTPTSPAADAALKASLPRPLSAVSWGQQTRNGEIVHVPDTEVDPAVPPNLRDLARMRGYRGMLRVPLLRDRAPIGLIIVTRAEPGPFADHHVQLLQTFADQAVIAIENARLFNETREALEQQKATSDLLQVIGNSVADTAPVFEKILDSCQNLFATEQLGIFLVRDGQVHVPAWRGGALEAMVATLPRPVEQTATGLVIESRRILHVPSAAAMPNMPPTVRSVYERIGDYSLASAPMLREQRGVGALVALRQPPKAFSDKELALLKTFADQAVIAIENTRMFNETREALERQTATADILKVIASSPSDVQPVFEAIAERANRLVEGLSTAVYSIVDDTQHLMAFTRKDPEADAVLQALFPRPLSAVAWGEQIRNGEIFHVSDTEVELSAQPSLLELARSRGFRSFLLVPLLRDRTPIGLISVTRAQPGRFAAHHVQLLQTFADQAVIAIENVRLFNETREALERQTATADILKVIASSPSDVQPVFEAIAASANRLIGGHSTAVSRFVDGVAHLAAFTPTSPAADELLKAAYPRRLADFPPFEWVRNGETGQIADAETIPDLRDLARARGYRSVLFAPLMSNGVPIGLIGVTRTEPGSFADHHVQLLQTFADQAVIAIENTRLFNETREALERQTATADILKVIASSPSDVQPVFEAIAASANRLIGGLSTAVHSLVDDTLHLAAFTPTSPAGDAALQASFPRPLSALPWGEKMRNGELVHVPDIEVEGAMLPDLRDVARMRGFRSILRVPLLRDRAPIGFISVTRVEPGMFAAHHVQLLQTFADQAVIAIENTRLFNETREALERQTATADILKVIASSPSDVQPVFEAIAASANRLLGGFSTAVLRFVDGVAHLAAFTPTNPAADELLRTSFPRPVAEYHPFELAQAGEVVQITDTETMTDAQIRDIARARGFRSMLFSP
jgi:GAF domain-containing protein